MGRRRKTDEQGFYLRASDRQIAERDRRHAARLRRDEAAEACGDLTPTFFNDPPPGCSALDRKARK